MAMGKRTVNAIGVVAGVAILAGGYFGVAAPILSTRSAAERDYENSKQLTNTYTKSLLNFQNGGQDKETQDATNTMELFKSLVPGSIDIESASRAIAESLPSGVKLQSFDFGTPQQVSTLELPDPKLSGFTAPEAFSGGSEDAAASSSSGSSSSTPSDTASAAADSASEAVAGANSSGTASGSSTAAPGGSTQGTNPSAGTGGFTRIPFTIEVSASSYDELADYLDSLGDQPRLMSVVSVDSSRSDGISAKVYAFAFASN